MVRVLIFYYVINEIKKSPNESWGFFIEIKTGRGKVGNPPALGAGERLVGTDRSDDNYMWV